MHVLVTRPEPDATALRTQLESMGHTVTVEPLLTTELMPIAESALEGVAALIVTSRNGVRALAASQAMSAARRLPLLAVGRATGELALDAGFTNVIAGDGTGEDLVPVVAAFANSLSGPLAHVRGEDTAFDLEQAVAARGIAIREVVAYRAVPAADLGPHARARLAAEEIDAVILMSPRTARIFARLVVAAGLESAVREIVALCLSPAVAAAIEPLRPARVEVADGPNASAMLAAVTRVATLWSGV